MNAAFSQPTAADVIALDFARMKIPVFPCGPGKQPLTQNGFKDATADIEIVAAFWRAHPSAMIGLPTGSASGLFVVDLDMDKVTGKALGEATLGALGLSHLLDTVPSVRTPSGGWHLYFRDVGLGCTTKRIGAGVDTRGEGGYIIAPGSVAPGGAYVLNNGPITLATLPDLPSALLKALQDRAKPDTHLLDIGTEATEAEVQEVLGHIPPDCGYDDWLTVLMGLHAHFVGSATGLCLADKWSAGGSKYKSGEVAPKWNSFQPGGGRGWASVCNLARQHGADLSHISRRHSRVASLTPSKPLVAPQSHSSGQSVSTETDAAEFFCAADFSAVPTPTRQWHVPGFLPAGTVTTLGGDGGTGKSLIALQLAVATALGTNWLGQPVKPGRALFISAEDDRDEIHRRVADIAGAEGVRLSTLNNLTLRSLAGKDALLAVPMPNPSDLLTETALFRDMDQWIATHRPALVVLDTLADLFGGNEINRSHARQFIGMLRGLALRNGTTVLLLAHPSLSGMATGSGSSGSTAWNNSVRSRIYLRRLKSNGSVETEPDARELEVMKANYGKTGRVLPLRWQDGVFVAERNTGDESEFDPKASGAKARRVFLTLLKQFTEEGRRVNPSSANTYAPKAFAGHQGAEGCKKAALKTAMDSLLADGQVIVCKEGPPSRLVTFLAIRE